MADRLDAALAELGAAIRELRTTPVPAPPPAPAGLDLSRWKLTLPVVKDGKALELLPTLPDRYEQVDPSRTFWEVLPDGSARLRTWHGGGTTSGSANPRTELRELTLTGGLADWSTTSGSHSLTVTTQVNRLTKVRPHVVLAQIHDDEDDVTVFRLENRNLWITDGDATHSQLVTASFELGQPYTLGFDVADGVIRYRFNGATLNYAQKKKTDGCYFKAGLYLQSNPKTAPGESTDEYAEVVLSAVQVVHS